MDGGERHDEPDSIDRRDQAAAPRLSELGLGYQHAMLLASAGGNRVLMIAQLVQA